MGKECMARLSRRLWGGTSLKKAAKEASGISAPLSTPDVFISLFLHLIDVTSFNYKLCFYWPLNITV